MEFNDYKLANQKECNLINNSFNKVKISNINELTEIYKKMLNQARYIDATHSKEYAKSLKSLATSIKEMKSIIDSEIKLNKIHATAIPQEYLNSPSGAIPKIRSNAEYLAHTDKEDLISPPEESFPLPESTPTPPNLPPIREDFPSQETPPQNTDSTNGDNISTPENSPNNTIENPNQNNITNNNRNNVSPLKRSRPLQGNFFTTLAKQIKMSLFGRQNNNTQPTLNNTIQSENKKQIKNKEELKQSKISNIYDLKIKNTNIKTNTQSTDNEKLDHENFQLLSLLNNEFISKKDHHSECIPHNKIVTGQIDIIRLLLLYLTLRPNCNNNYRLLKITNDQFDILLDVL